ncbi:hypothetical protein GCM10010510_67290 [Streptomyces anandii JCM 4720]|nr:hypothetical protein GCM10010510_67290 [Streptomyces anandii JCM 4720]
MPDLVMRDFTAEMLNTKWCGDMTYVAVGSTWLYLATVIDICSRRGVGWSITDHMRTSLVTDAIEMAVVARGGHVHGVVFHTDRGAQYGSAAFAEVCRRHGIRRSMGRVGSSYDNALAESFFQGLKRELPHGRRWTSRRGRGGNCSAGCRTKQVPPPLRPRLPRASRSGTATDHVTYAHSSHESRCPRRGSTSHPYRPFCCSPWPGLFGCHLWAIPVTRGEGLRGE